MIIQKIYVLKCINKVQVKEGKRSINGRGTTKACDIVLLVPNNNLMSIIYYVLILL